MKKIILFTMVVILSLSMVGCYSKSADMEQTLQTEDIMNEQNRQVGMPNLPNFYEKKLAKDIYELRDDSELITFAYFQNLDGQFVFLGKAIGYGLPYSVQYTNPEKYSGVATKKVLNDAGKDWTYSYEMVPQPEPNGLFMPEGLSATWLILINEETGEREIMYTEPSIIVTQTKLPKRLCAEWSLPDNY